VRTERVFRRQGCPTACPPWTAVSVVTAALPLSCSHAAARWFLRLQLPQARRDPAGHRRPRRTAKPPPAPRPPPSGLLIPHRLPAACLHPRMPLFVLSLSNLVRLSTPNQTVNTDGAEDAQRARALRIRAFFRCLLVEVFFERLRLRIEAAPPLLNPGAPPSPIICVTPSLCPRWRTGVDDVDGPRLPSRAGWPWIRDGAGLPVN